MNVTILGKDYAVKFPVAFAVKEALVLAYADTAGQVSQRQLVLAALLGLCTPFGAERKFDFVKARFDVLAYGNAVYSYLRTNGAKMEDLLVAVPIFTELAPLVFPREAEVQSEVDFSGPPRESSTEKP